MQIILSGHHVELTTPLQDYARKKIEKLQKFSDQLIRGKLTLKVEKHIHRAEATIHVQGADLHATSDHTDMYAAIDLLVDKLVHQITKYKTKHFQHHNLN